MSFIVTAEMQPAKRQGMDGPCAGLLDDPATIGTRTGWLTGLQGHGLSLRGHLGK